MTLSSYTGGNSGWGTMISRCANCGEIVAEYYCDEEGRPTTAIFDDAEGHICEFEEEEEEREDWDV